MGGCTRTVDGGENKMKAEPTFERPGIPTVDISFWCRTSLNGNVNWNGSSKNTY